MRIQTKKYGCLQLSWNLSQQQAWMVNWRLDLEVRRRLAVQAVSGQWSEQPVSKTQCQDLVYEPVCVCPYMDSYIACLCEAPWCRTCLILKSYTNKMHLNPQQILLNGVKTTRSVDLCRLLHGTRYLAQIRVRYQGGPWSEWSSSRSGVTLENGAARINSE